MQSAYFHMQLTKACHPLTAFLTQDGLFQYCRLPMGLKSAASAFQKMIAQILAGLDGVVSYQDDLLIFASSQQQHDSRLCAVLQRLLKYDLRLNFDKCKISADRVLFLGHYVSAKGLEPSPENVSAVVNFSTPTDVKSLQSFLAMCSYHLNFIPNFSTIAYTCIGS